MVRWAAALVAALVACLLWSASAHAWSASIGGSVLTISDPVGAEDVFGVRDPLVPGVVEVADFGDGFAGPVPVGCSLSADEVLACPVAGLSELVVQAGTADDEVLLSSVRVQQRVDAGPGADVVAGSPLGDVIEGGVGEDVVDGGGGADEIAGGDDADELSGGAGVDVLDGGAGEDALGAGADGGELIGGAGADELTGGDGADVLSGGSGADVLDGGGGDDTLDGGEDADELAGGAGVNTLVGGGGDDLLSLEGEAGDVGDGGSGDDEISADAATGSVTIAGGDGADVIEGGVGADQITAGADGDEVFGADGDDTIDAGSGDDAIEPGAGVNTARGGAGADELVLDGAAGDVAFGDDGDDTLIAGAAGARLDGGAGQDTLEGDEDADVLHGGPGADALTGGDGADVLAGDGENDELDGGPGPDAIWGGPGSDHLSYADAEDAVTVSLDDQPGDGTAGEGDNAHADIERLTGSFGDDRLEAAGVAASLSGGDGDDFLVGGAGVDRLEGGFGDDTLDGGGLGDTMVGGAGEDTVTYAARLASVGIALGDPGPVSGEAGEHDTIAAVENAVGGAAADRISGSVNVPNRIDAGAGNDVISVHDQDAAVDEIECGGGRDRAQADRHDGWGEDCEAVIASGVLQAPGIEPAGRRRVTLREDGIVRVRVRCLARSARWCRGTLVLRTAPGRRIGRGGYRIVSGQSKWVRVRVRAAARRGLERRRRGHRVRVRATSTVRDVLDRRHRARFALRMRVQPR